MGMGFLGSWIISADLKLWAVGDAFIGLDKLEVGTDVFLPLFLPPLLFTAGLTIDVRRLMDEIHAVLLLAIVAVLVCIACVAGVVHFATGIDLVVCLLLGAVVSTTDPAAVIGIFRDVGAPKRLSILAEGESLLNDAVAIAAFGLFIGIIASQSFPDPVATIENDPTSAVGVFLREFIGGLLLGFAMARAAMVILPRLGESDAAIASVTVSLCYLSFVLADRYLHVSGVVSVVMAALTLAAYGPTHLHPRQWTALRQIWTQLEFWANCLIFVLASMLAANVLLKISWLYVWGVAAVAVGAFLARALVVFGMLPVLEATKLVQPVDSRYKAILVWGGLRGAVTIVLAMVAAGDLRLPIQVRDFIAISAVLFVLFTLFVNATTLGLVMHVFGLDKLSRLELALRDRVLALSRVNVDRHLRQIMRQQNARADAIDVDPASAGDAEVEPVPTDLALDLDERVKIGLVTLCTREKELYLELFEQQILSRRMVAVLAASADRLIDTVRDKGVAGYEEWLEEISRPGSRLPPRAVAASALRLRRHADRAAGRPLRDPDGLAKRSGRTCCLQHQFDRRPAGTRRRDTSGGADRQSPDRRRRGAASALPAVSGLCGIDPGAAARAGGDPLRRRRNMPGVCARASSAARSTTTCASKLAERRGGGSSPT